MYQSFYKLTGKPFRLSPDPGFFFPSRGHKRALAYLRYGLKQDEGFVVITGAPGTGKTTLAKILLNEMGDSNVVVAHLTTTQLDSAEMLRMVVASFGLRYEGLDKTALLKTLESFLLARARERKRALLVIDEAQNLPTSSLEELRMLSNMQAGDKALVQTFLLGQDQFRKTLDHRDMEQLRQRVIANFQLSPLAADETQRYIESRLGQVGWAGDPTFAEIAYEKIHAHTGGVPRRINMLCDRVLLFASVEERHQITSETIGQVISEIDREETDGGISSIERLKQTTQASQVAMKRLAKTRKENNLRAEKNKKTKKKVASPETLATSEMPQIDIEDTLIMKAPKISAPLGMEDTLTIKGPEADLLRRATNAVTKTSAAKTTKRPKTIKPKKKTAKASKKDDPNATAQILGNTLPKKRPAKVASVAQQPSEISERDLFRVIPGGRQSAPADTGMDKTMQSTAASRKSIVPPPSAEDVVLRRILRLVLAFHRSPSRFPGLDNVNQPLPEGITELLELAVSDDQTLTKVSPAAVMGISPVMLRAAVRFFVRRSLFVATADDYRVLGLQSAAEQPQLEKHYDLMMRLLRQDKQRGSEDSITRIGEAYEALSHTDYSVQVPAEDSPARTPTADVNPGKQPNTILPRRDNADDETLVIGKSSEDSNKKFANNGDITFDFTEVQQEPVYDKHAGMMAKIGESFSFEDNDDGMSEKRLRYSGLMAMLGFGALVVILGLYIVQIDPEEDEAVDNDAPRIAQTDSNRESANLSVAELEREASLTDDGNDNSSSSEQDTVALSDEQASTQSDIADLLKKMEARRMKIRESRHSRKRTQLNQQESTASSFASKEENAEQSASILDAINQPSSDMRDREAGVTASEVSQPARRVVKIQSRRNVSSRAGFAPSPRLTPNPRQSAPRIVAKPIIPALPSGGASTRSSSKSISTEALNKMLADFSRAYQAGDINKLTALFSLNARTNNQTSSVGIRSDYLELFQGSNFRAMSFPTLSWENQGPNRVRGLGTYEARISAKGESSAKIFSGKLTLRAENIANKLKITQFYFTEDNVASAGDSNLENRANRNAVTQAEVDRFITAFVENYEQSQLDPLMALFAEDARTNDQTSLAGIRKDHQDLFTTTTARQMFLKNMSWRFEGSRVYGGGDFEVLIQANNSDEFVSYVGKITIKMLKVAGKLKMTHLLHNTQ